MALDPNIILQAGRGVTPIQTFDPTEVQAKQIGLAQAMQNMQDAQQFRQTYGMSPGLAKQIQEMTSAQATAQKSAIDLRASQIDAADKLSDRQLGIMKWAKDALDKNPQNAPQIHAQLISQMKQNAQDLTPWVDTSKSDDPASFSKPDGSWDNAAQKSWLENKISQVPLTKQQLEAAKVNIQGYQYHPETGFVKITPSGPVKVAGEPINIEAAHSLIDQNIPASGPTASLNQGAKNEVSYWGQLGRNDMVTKAIENWQNKANDILKIADPTLRQLAIDKAAAEAAASTSARLKIEQANQTGAVAKLNPTAANAASDKYFKASQDFNIATQAADNMDSFIEAAKSGNKVAHGFLPTEGALEASTAQGVKRVNMAEIKSYGGAGSLMDRIEGQLKGLSTGQSIPPQILDDMKKVSDAIRRNATTKHESAVKAVNVSYGSSFEPLSKKSGAISLDDYLKQQGH